MYAYNIYRIKLHPTGLSLEEIEFGANQTSIRGDLFHSRTAGFNGRRLIVTIIVSNLLRMLQPQVLVSSFAIYCVVIEC